MTHEVLLPPCPEVADAERAAGPLALRYEDVLQDGRMLLVGMGPSVGTVWKRLIEDQAMLRVLMRQGIVPILTRFVVRRVGAPIGLGAPLEVRGCYQLAHAVAREGGGVSRLFLNMWTSLRGRVGRVHGPPPARAGEPVEVGRVFAEHTMTRPFGPPAERKVLALEVPGLPEVPPALHDFRPARELCALPPGAAEADPEWVVAGDETVFGLDHTDSNQHVNSMAYPRVFVDEALRRFAARGWSAAVTAQALDVRFRKPCFAGQRLRVASRACLIDGQPVLAAGLWEAGDARRAAETDPHVAILLVFER